MSRDEEPPIDWESARGADWAQFDPNIAVKYGGNWVVARNREIIAAGSDPDVVREEASRHTGIPGPMLIVCSVATLDSRW